MSTLLFYDDSHRYTIDGEEVPSVSELTRFIARELYETTPQFAMDGAASRGTKVHKATEALDKFGTVEVESDITPYLQAYVQFRKDIDPEWEKIEWPVCYEKEFAGTVDRYGKINGVPVIMDIKTTQSITGLHKVLYTAQLNLYRLAVMKEKEVDQLWVVQLRKDGTYKLIQLDENEALAQACLIMHNTIKNSKRRKKKRDQTEQEERKD